jgi:predicted enzyme related to lactoylglutathione lyase
MANAKRGDFVWYEHMTKDPKAAIAFYSEVVGWKTQPFQEGGDGDYVMWVGGQGPLGGVTRLPEQAEKMGAPPQWMAHVLVDDVASTVALARQLGAKIFVEPHEVPTVGTYAVVSDPQGATLSVFRPLREMPLHDVSKQGEICWHELLTSDSAAAFAFHSQLFGWKIVQEMDMGPMGTYRIFGAGERSYGGMMTVPTGAPIPPMWLYYADVSDLDAAIARATRMGAKVMNGPMEVPGGARIVQMLDPQGAAFALHEQPKTK